MNEYIIMLSVPLCLASLAIFIYAYDKKQEQRLQDKISSILSKERFNVLSGQRWKPSEDSQLEWRIEAFHQAYIQKDYLECQYIFFSSFIENMGCYFSNNEYKLLQDNRNVRNYLRESFRSFWYDYERYNVYSEKEKIKLGSY